jgi:hypothetical protein
MSNFDALFGESEFDLRDLSPANNLDTMSIHGLLDAQKKSVERGDRRGDHGRLESGTCRTV